MNLSYFLLKGQMFSQAMGLVGLVWSLPVLLSFISCIWILLGVIRMGTGWTIAVSGPAGAMLESNWVRVCELEEHSLNVSHCWTDRGETSQHDEKDGVKDHWRSFSKVIQRLHCKLCFVGLTNSVKFYFSINILYYLCKVSSFTIKCTVITDLSMGEIQSLTEQRNRV